MIFIALGFICYWNILGSSFLSDDHLWLDVYRGNLFSLLKNNFTDAFFLPLTHLIEFFLFKIFGYNYTVYHVITLLLHCMNALLVGTLLKKLYKYYKVKITNNYVFIFVGLLFLALPYQTEAVTWYSAKSYVIAAFFFLISLICYLEFKESGKLKHLIISLISFALSILTKEIGIVLPLIIVLIELTSVEKIKTNSLKDISLFFIILAAYFIIRYFALGSLVGGYNESVHLGFDLKIIFYNYFLYILKFFAFFRYLPAHNALVYTIMIISGVILISLFIIGLIKAKKEGKPALLLTIVLVVVFIILLLPVINLETTFLSQVQSDRYGYLPSVAAVFIFVVIIDFIAIPFRVKNIFFLAILIVFTYFTIDTNRLWSSASAKSDKILRSIIDQTTKRTKEIYIMNIPDNYRGIYMFRGGLKEALYSLDNNTAPIKIFILSHQINNSNDLVLLAQQADLSNTITLPFGDKFINIDTISFQKQTFIKINFINSNKINFKNIPNFNYSSCLFLYYDNECFKSIFVEPELIKY